MKKIVFVAIVALFYSNIFAAEKITFKTAKSSSSYYQMAVQLGEIINMANDGKLSVTIEESQGSVQNVKEAQRRSGNYLFTTPPGLMSKALNLEGAFEKDKKENYEKVRSLFVIPYLTMHFVVRKDANIKSFEDLKGKTILVARGTFGANEGKKYLEAFGLLNDVKIVEAELSAAVSAMKNGKIDGFITSGSFPAPNVMEVSSSMDVEILSLNDEQIALTKRDMIIIPKGTYKGVDVDIKTTTLPVGVYATNLSEDTAYMIVKSFWEGKSELEKNNPWWKSVTFDRLKDLKIPMHEGALKYYKEKNLDFK